MNLIKVGRYNLKPDWTISRLYINNVQDGFACEDEIRDIKVKGETAIPYGTYPLGLRQSPKFSSSFLYSDSHNMLIEAKEKSKFSNITDWRLHDLIWVKNIPGFEYVLIHWGNSDDDTEGCLLVGSGLGIDAKGQEIVTNSRKHYKKMYEKVYPTIKKGNQFIEYVKE